MQFPISNNIEELLKRANNYLYKSKRYLNAILGNKGERVKTNRKRIHPIKT
jgi:hypothetical protein